MREGDRAAAQLSLPIVQRLLSRADQRSIPGSDLESTLCHLYAVERGSGGDYPIAALCRGKSDGRFWLQAEPVCLRPVQNRLLLFDTLEFDVDTEELRTLAARFCSHFEHEEWIVETDDLLCWYLSPVRPTEISSHRLGDVFGRNMDMFLPQGKDRLYWHRLLNEVQMLFFDSGVNQLRESAGKMPIGGLWFSGFGALSKTISARFQRLFGQDRLTMGLARLTDVPLAGVQECRGELVYESGESLVVYPYLQRPVWRADSLTWAERVAEFNCWLQPWWNDLLAGRLSELSLYPCDGRLFQLTRRHCYRIWRASKPLSSWLHTAS